LNADCFCSSASASSSASYHPFEIERRHGDSSDTSHFQFEFRKKCGLVTIVCYFFSFGFLLVHDFGVVSERNSALLSTVRAPTMQQPLNCIRVPPDRRPDCPPIVAQLRVRDLHRSLVVFAT
jgi:hypothetical protein